MSFKTAALNKIKSHKLKTSLMFLFLCGVSVTAYFWFAIKLPEFSQVKSRHKPSDTWILDRNAFPLESLRTSNSERSLAWVGVDEISPAFLELLIRVEDKRFLSHSGVDIFALTKVFVDRLSGRSYRGGSTLSMQLVGLLDKEPKLHRRGLKQKLKQIFSALKLETHWNKNQILEAYANLVPIRGELVGLRAASLGYFLKHPEGLHQAEAALLIALIRAPNASPAAVSARACKILGSESCNNLNAIAAELFSKSYQLPRSRELVPVLNEALIDRSLSTETVIHTSLEYRIQKLALESMREQLRQLSSQNMQDAAVLVLETKTGRVVAYAANAGPGHTTAVQVDGIRMRRQAGSTVKAFVYATAIEDKLLNPDSLLQDSPADIPISEGRVYHPRNYDHSFRGVVGVGDALGSSLNVPAVRALKLVGEERVLENLRQLGFEDLENDDYYGLSLALGAVDVSLWQLTNAYRKLAHQDSPFSKDTQEKIFNILASPEHRRYTFGFNSVLSLPFAAAVKTGTSKDMRDNWCIGYTDKYTVGVWVGNFDGKPMWNVSGTSGAAPIWQKIMRHLHPEPTKLTATYVAPGKPLNKRLLSHIRYPVKDMLVGLDPEIPKAMQKLPIEIENPQATHQIFLNKKLLSPAQDTYLWPIKKGRYQVELKNQTGELLDKVNFEVR